MVTVPTPASTFEIEANRPPWSPTGARPTCTHAKTMRATVHGRFVPACMDCKMPVPFSWTGLVG
jgi:hypothetical protein